jgi:topoisomerase IV subunit A
MNVENTLVSFQATTEYLTINTSGTYMHTGYDLSLHFDEDLAHIRKHENGKILTAIYYHGSKEGYFLKRFVTEPNRPINNNPQWKTQKFWM